MCLIEMRSWGKNDMKKIGYIRVNGNLVANLSQDTGRGFNIVELNSSDCSTSASLYFDTHGNILHRMNDYLRSLPANVTLLGVTVDEAFNRLGKNTMRTLSALGINSLYNRGKLIFVATKGRPELSVADSTRSGGRNLQVYVSVASTYEVTGACIESRTFRLVETCKIVFL